MKNYPKNRASPNTRPPKHELEYLFNVKWTSQEVADLYEVKLRTVGSWKEFYKLTKPRNSQPPSFSNQKLGYVEDEEFKPLVLRLKPDIVTDNYKVSQYGNIIGPGGVKLRWGNSRDYPHVILCLPNDIFPDFIGVSATNKDSTGLKSVTQRKTIAVHRAVANTFLARPVPEPFKEIWHALTEKQQGWTQRVYDIDHIDGDKSNPHVSNLQYLTPWQNNIRVKSVLGLGLVKDDM